MTKQLTRYDTDRDGDEYATETGPYVHYTDAQVEIERLQKERAGAIDRLTPMGLEIGRLQTGIRQLAHKAAEELGGFHSLVTFAEELLEGGGHEPKPNAAPGESSGPQNPAMLDGGTTISRELAGQDFDKDLAHLISVRNTMADMKRYGSLQGIPMHEADFLLSFIDNLWREYSRGQSRTTVKAP